MAYVCNRCGQTVDKIIALGDATEIRESFQIWFRTYFSIQHIQASALFARKAYQLEQQYSLNNAGTVLSEHQAYVTGAIFSSVSFLEANINELYSDCADSHQKNGLDSQTIAIMGKLWNRGILRPARLLEKYELALDIASREGFDRGSSPYQDVKLLIELRNSLIHYKPETILARATPPSDVNELHKIEKRLKGKFQINPLAAPGNPFYPDKCLGHGCAQWAVNKSMEFADLFYVKMGVKPPYDHVRDQTKAV